MNKDECDRKHEAVDAVLWGNGKEGLVQKITKLELVYDQINAQLKSINERLVITERIMWGAAGVIIAAQILAPILQHLLRNI